MRDRNCTSLRWNAESGRTIFRPSRGQKQQDLEIDSRGQSTQHAMVWPFPACDCKQGRPAVSEILRFREILDFLRICRSGNQCQTRRCRGCALWRQISRGHSQEHERQDSANTWRQPIRPGSNLELQPKVNRFRASLTASVAGARPANTFSITIKAARGTHRVAHRPRGRSPR